MIDTKSLPEKPAVMLSGGLDSTILAHTLVGAGISFTGIFVDYGQRNALNSRRVVNRLSRSFSIPVEIISIPGLASSFVGNMDEEYDDFAVMLCEVHEEPWSFIPIITLAAGLAVSIGSNALLLGYNRTDRDSDDDRYRNTQIISDSIGSMYSLNRSVDFSILTPLWDIPKAQVIEHGMRLMVPVEETWSCWDSQPVHCGRCPGCEDRREAFTSLAGPDPTRYA